MPSTSTTVDLGAHALEISANGEILIASHPQSGDIPIREVVQLESNEAYKLYCTLHAHFQARAELLHYREVWRQYCVLDAVQHPWTDRMHCTGCGAEQLVAHLNDSGRCAVCLRAAPENDGFHGADDEKCGGYAQPTDAERARSRAWKAAAALASTPGYHWSAGRGTAAGVEEHGEL